MMQRWLLMFHGGGNHAKRTEHSRDIIKKICSDQLTKRAAENRKKKLSKPNYPRQRCPHTLWSQLRKNAEQCKELFIWQNASRP